MQDRLKGYPLSFKVSKDDIHNQFIRSWCNIKLKGDVEIGLNWIQISDDSQCSQFKFLKTTFLIVPMTFMCRSQIELQALLCSGGLNVLQLMSEPMAVALNYGMFRRKEINGTVRHMMMYDMGAQDTTVSVVAYQIVKIKEKGYTETHPQVE